jgi:hypothetical protein
VLAVVVRIAEVIVGHRQHPGSSSKVGVGMSDVAAFGDPPDDVHPAEHQQL